MYRAGFSIRSWRYRECESPATDVIPGGIIHGNITCGERIADGMRIMLQPAVDSGSRFLANVDFGDYVFRKLVFGEEGRFALHRSYYIDM